MAFYDQVHTVEKFRLGTRVRDVAGNEYIYLQGIGSTAIGSWVNFDGGTAFVTALVDSDTAATCLGRLAVAKAAVGASQFGWYCIYGATDGLALTGLTDGKTPNAVSTGGSVDDGGGGLEITILGAFSTSAVDETSLLASFALNYPFMPGVAAD